MSEPFQIDKRVELKEQVVTQVVKTPTSVQDLILPNLTATEREILYQLGNWHINIANHLKNIVDPHEAINFTAEEISDFLVKFYIIYKNQEGRHNRWLDLQRLQLK